MRTIRSEERFSRKAAKMLRKRSVENQARELRGSELDAGIREGEVL
jgi:hypothetical protein